MGLFDLGRRFRLVSVFLLSVFLLSSCAVSPLSPSTEDAHMKIVTTIFPPYDFAREIAGDTDGVSLVQLLRPGMESHTFDPTPADILTVGACDIFICVGGESDAWVDTLLSSVDTEHMTVLRLIDMVDCVEEETTEGMTVHEHEHGHEHDTEDSDEIEYDEHVWTSPKNAKLLCEGIAEAMISVDAAHETEYRQNLSAYLGKLDALDRTFTEITENAPLSAVVFGDRFPFRYLCDAYGLSYRAAFPGCAAESEPSAATMAYLIEKIKKERIPVVFNIEMSSGKIASAIAEETGAVVRRLHSCHNRTADEAKAGKTYLDLMLENADALREALQTKENP